MVNGLRKWRLLGVLEKGQVCVAIYSIAWGIFKDFYLCKLLVEKLLPPSLHNKDREFTSIKFQCCPYVDLCISDTLSNQMAESDGCKCIHARLDDNHFRALCMAAKKGHAECVAILLQRGAADDHRYFQDWPFIIRFSNQKWVITHYK